MSKKILIGNSFPLSLVRREVEIEPVDLTQFVVRLDAALTKGDQVVSFWGCSNTLKVASDILGVDLTPKTERPALSLSSNNLISFEGETYHIVYILSPDYRPGFRPAIGVEVGPEDITGWTVLRVRFPRRVEHGKLV